MYSNISRIIHETEGILVSRTSTLEAPRNILITRIAHYLGLLVTPKRMYVRIVAVSASSIASISRGWVKGRWPVPRGTDAAIAVIKGYGADRRGALHNLPSPEPVFSSQWPIESYDDGLQSTGFHRELVQRCQPRGEYYIDEFVFQLKRTIFLFHSKKTYLNSVCVAVVEISLNKCY